MDPFINLPDELTVKMCEGLETPDLLRLSESSSRVYQVCHGIIEKRRETFEVSKIKEIEDMILKIPNTLSSLVFEKNLNLPDSYAIVKIDDWKGDQFYIRQTVYISSSVHERILVPDILKGNLSQVGSKFRNWKFNKQDYEKIKELATNLVQQKYKFDSSQSILAFKRNP